LVENALDVGGIAEAMTTVDVGAVSSSFNGTTSNGASSPGSSSNNKEISSVLPPCRVCGERASGFHYGANTCEACKVSLYITLYFQTKPTSIE